MASFFNLILDTLAPSGLTLKLNNGATYAMKAPMPLMMAHASQMRFSQSHA